MAPEGPGDAPAGSPVRFTDVELLLRSDETLFRVIALLHRKHVLVGALIWLPDDRHHHGRRLRLAIASRHTPEDHVITLMQQVIGVMDVRLSDPATDRPALRLRWQHAIQPTRYVAWSQRISQTPASHRVQQWDSTGSLARRT